MSASKEAICSSSEKEPEKPHLGKFKFHVHKLRLKINVVCRVSGSGDKIIPLGTVNNSSYNLKRIQ